MLSKRDKLFLAFDRLDGLVCPVCRAPLARDGDDLACPHRHRLNVNRKGCLNVLSQQVDSCYDAALFDARRRVFAAGCYNAVVEAIEALLVENKTLNPDLNGTASTAQVGDAIVAILERRFGTQHNSTQEVT